MFDNISIFNKNVFSKSVFKIIIYQMFFLENTTSDFFINHSIFPQKHFL